MPDRPRKSQREFSTLDLIRRYLSADEKQRPGELEAAASAIRAELTPDEMLALAGLLSRGLLELVAERQREEGAPQFSSAATAAHRELFERAAEAIRDELEASSPPKGSTRRARRTYIGACPECGSQAGLHALSCSRYRQTRPLPPLTDELLTELRALPASQWSGWPPDDYDQGLPVVELRQDHLAALLAAIRRARRER